jgi:hypothetical protein
MPPAIVFLFLFLGVCLSASAGDLNLSGIFQGNQPTAFVNDQVVAVGDRIDGNRVVEIGNDYVVFENDKRRFVVHLKEAKAVSIKPAVRSVTGATPPSVPRITPPAKPASPVQVPEKAGRYLDKSIENLRQADELLKSKVKFDGLYAKASMWCVDASREAQSALNNVSDEAGRNAVKDHLAKIQKLLTAIQKERAELNTRVRTAIANQQIFPGMTAQDVLSSWGTPLSKTNVGTLERWAYKDPNGYQRNLNFSGGILVSF